MIQCRNLPGVIIGTFGLIIFRIIMIIRWPKCILLLTAKRQLIHRLNAHCRSVASESKFYRHLFFDDIDRRRLRSSCNYEPRLNRSAFGRCRWYCLPRKIYSAGVLLWRHINWKNIVFTSYWHTFYLPRRNKKCFIARSSIIMSATLRKPWLRFFSVLVVSLLVVASKLNRAKIWYGHQ